MMRKFRLFCLIFTLFMLIGMVGFAAAQTADGYALDWWTVDGGGGTGTAGGYTLTGSIGQPDAGELSGGGYTLSGGFWGVPVETVAATYEVHLPFVRR